MLKQKYFLADIFILSAEKQPIKLSWREIVWLQRKASQRGFPYGVRQNWTLTNIIGSIISTYWANGIAVLAYLVIFWGGND